MKKFGRSQRQFDFKSISLHPSTSQPTGGKTSGVEGSRTKSIREASRSSHPSTPSFDPSTFADQPPVSNTGAEITAPLENRVLFDFVSFTFPKENDPAEVFQLIGLDADLFAPCAFGSMGYKKSLRYSNISVLFDGNVDMGVHVSMTGQGCRAYEYQLAKKDGNPWLSLFENILLHAGTFTRLDIAVDNIDGQLDLDRLEAQIYEKNVRSRFRNGRRIDEFTLTDESKNLGKTLYLGSSQSRLQIRFYDKAAQLGINQHWTRAEMQLRAERADVAARLYKDSLEPSQIFTGVMNNYFTLINHDDTNKTRCSTQEWWKNWLQSTEKLKLTIQKAKKTCIQVADYIRKQYAPSIAMLKEYFNHDFQDFIRSVVKEGTERMGLKHYQMLHEAT